MHKKEKGKLEIKLLNKNNRAMYFECKIIKKVDKVDKRRKETKSKKIPQKKQNFYRLKRFLPLPDG